MPAASLRPAAAPTAKACLSSPYQLLLAEGVCIRRGRPRVFRVVSPASCGRLMRAARPAFSSTGGRVERRDGSSSCAYPVLTSKCAQPPSKAQAARNIGGGAHLARTGLETAQRVGSSRKALRQLALTEGPSAGFRRLSQRGQAHTETIPNASRRKHSRRGAHLASAASSELRLSWTWRT